MAPFLGEPASYVRARNFQVPTPGVGSFDRPRVRNFLGDADAARSSYGDETYNRLVALKNDYDPTNVFQLNQNIEPQATAA